MTTELQAVGQIALPVTDPDRAQAFYGDVLGLGFLYRYGDLVFFSCGNLRLLVEKVREGPVKPEGCVYFTVSDMDAAYVALQGRGVSFQGKPQLIARMPDHELWMAFFLDPDGHQLAIMCEKR